MEFSSEILSSLKNSKVVAILTHIRPDADCLGSASALKGMLLKLGKVVDIFCDDIINENFMFIPYMSDINPIKKQYDLVVVVDCSDLSRVGRNSSFLNVKVTSISIDHHLFGSKQFTTYLKQEPVSSTAEILYYLPEKLGVEIDSNIATALYCGMASDTGCFIHSNTSGTLHKIVGEIYDKIENIENVNYQLFKKKTVGQIELMKRMLNNMRFICDGKVAISYLKEKDFKETKTQNTETFGLVDICANLASVEIGIFFSEKSHNLYACSLRGKNRDVAFIAELFGGGGHKFASGCNIFGSYNLIISKFEKAINENYDRICKC